MKLSIIIPAFQAEADLPVVLGSIVEPAGHEVELIVVDDSSSDRTAAVAREAGCVVVELAQNSGPAAARNAGAEAASGEILVFVDADVELYPNTLTGIVAAFESHTDCAAVVGNLSTDLPPSGVLSRYKNLYTHYSFKDAGPWISVTFTSLTAVRAEAFSQCGGMPDIHPNEDRAFGIALTRDGHRIRFEPSLVVRHHHQYGLREFIEMEFQRGRNVFQLKLEARFSDAGPMDEHVPSPFSVAALCVAGAWVGLASTPLSGPIGAAVAVGGAAGAGLSLSPFLQFLSKHGGIRFAGLCYPIALADLSLALLGAATAMAEFLGGRRLMK